MLLRRSLLLLSLAFVGFASGPVFGQTSQQAASFVDSLGNRLVGVVNGPGSPAQKKASLAQMINADVDVDGVARFCLGRYWRVATAEQQQQYEALFRHVLITSITSKIGDYQGVHFTISRTSSGPEGQVVSTTIASPQKPPAQVDWVVRDVGGTPKVVDLIAEGTSLRLTQRDDYASFIVQHNESVQALIDALRRQATQNA